MRTFATRVLAVAALSGLLAGCSMTLAVRGASDNGDETFEGTATGYMDGAGDMKVTSSKGITCSGDFVYVTSREGRGTFTCADGRSGPFEFVSTGTRGTGVAVLGGRRYTFTFG